ncbi:MAG: L,D-transpeptidase family protein [Campylobacterales bacterium]|nr:L,D-transpeptidase family protein [Campylobacterales bacterium]
MCINFTKVKRIFIIITIIFTFLACSSNEKSIDVSKSSIKVYKEKINFYNDKNLNKKEKEFFNILEIDKYASLCGNKKEYLIIKNMEYSKKKSYLIKDLFYKYTYNLSNSCLNQKNFKSKLRKLKKNNQFYETYNIRINKKQLLKEYDDSSISISKILKKYTPTHPYFFKLINKLNDKSLNKKQLYLLRVNIERLKLLKDYKSNSFIQLNIPSYDFKFYENSKLIKSFGTVVGAYSSQTPILSSKLSHFIINPTWNIPDSIAASSVIPKSLKDKNYLKKKNIVIRKNYNLSSREYKFEDINWRKYLKKNVRYIPYKFIQLPSSSNGMGRVKFLFKNSYAVYMHDTIGSWRFKINKEKIRVISHGCIRLEHPLSLIKHISANYTRKSYVSVKRSYDKELTKTIFLSKYLPIHITYLTVGIKNNKLFFYKDIYLYDKIQKLNFNN